MMSDLQEHQVEDSILNIARVALDAEWLVLMKVGENCKPERIIASGNTDFTRLDRVLPSLKCREAMIEVAGSDIATVIGRCDDDVYLLLQCSQLTLSPEKTLCQVQRLLPFLSSLVVTRTDTDALQHLPGRSVCLDHIQQQINAEIWTERRRSFAVIRASLAGLDLINHSYGWDVANQLIAILTARLVGEGAVNLFIGHFGGGQFIFVAPPGKGRATIAEWIEKLRTAATAAVRIGEFQYTPDIKFALVFYPDNGSTPASLLRVADIEVQKKCQNRLRSFPSVVDVSGDSFASTQSFEQDLQKAIERHELYLEWQPTTAISTMKIVSREALLRWARPSFGPVSAASLIPCAETSGLIDRIDEWSLRAACSAASDWADDLTVCVNISPTWLAHERLARLVEDVLTQTGLSARRLQIDFTEKTDFGASESVYRELAKLRALGVAIALDDFGTGYSSLERLTYYPVDKIKIARSFLRRLPDDPRSCRILQHIVHLARSLNIVCCAKGVETEQQMAFLASYGYEEVQGFLVGQPREAIAENASTHPKLVRT